MMRCISPLVVAVIVLIPGDGRGQDVQPPVAQPDVTRQWLAVPGPDGDVPGVNSRNLGFRFPATTSVFGPGPWPLAAPYPLTEWLVNRCKKGVAEDCKLIFRIQAYHFSGKKRS